jgi:protein-tyrosine phosphatase
MGLFSFLGKSKNTDDLPPMLVDMHSHLLPAIDDGSESLDDSIALIKELVALGYKKLITTPHIMGDFYKNTPEIINAKLDLVRKALVERGIEVKLEAAAEYYLDEVFMKNLDDGAPLLSFGNNYVLFETSYINESSFLAEAIFKMKSLGYRPVLAHPERYIYLYSGFSSFQAIYDKGVLFQINLNSLSGYYSKAAQKFASRLVKEDMVDFVGTDCHGVRHIDALKKARATKDYVTLLNSRIINNSLLG